MHSISKISYLVGLFIIVSIFSGLFLSAQNASLKPDFRSPLDIPLYLSSNYGEYRSGHFHAGVDFKTQQVENKNVYAVDSGYVYRIVVLAASYGKAIYLKHPSGHITLYGHLNKFDPEVEKYIREQQYSRKSFSVDLYPDPDRFIYRKGDYIGLSGNTGMSFGAHLHFEVRDRSGAIPLNPLEYGFQVSDRTRPEIRWLMVYPLDTASFVNGSRNKFPLKTINSGRLNRVDPDTINVWGNIGIGIETYDYLDNTSNQCGPASIEVQADGDRIFLCLIDSISFSSGGYLYSHFDYDEMLRSGRKIQKLFIDPNNKLSIYKLAINRGILNFHDSKIHPVKIVVKDTYGNESVLNFNFRSLEIEKAPSVVVDSSIVQKFFYDSLNVFENESVRIAVPEDALFNHIDFQYREEKNDSFSYSLVHKVHNRYTALLRPYILSIRSINLADSLCDKALIASRAARGLWLSQGGEYSHGYVTANVRTFGDFVITLDTVPPGIKPINFTPRGKYLAGRTISFSITDTLSGIRKYAGYIDKNWALFEYDLKNDLLSYTIDQTRLASGKVHDLEIVVTDNKGNVGRFKSSFYY
ncbi:MAG TPA: M23 family metallopeptidase [Bacteroidales bacterium]|nr:M23 family metallopeptidase [Bacteroidales bacterium]